MQDSESPRAILSSAQSGLVLMKAKNYKIYPGAILNADPLDFTSMSWGTNCACGKPGNRVVNFDRRLCEGCFFRYTVMEAAGRAEEFWEEYQKQYADNGIGGWVSYNVKYSVSKPDTTIRIRNIKASEVVS